MPSFARKHIMDKPMIHIWTLAGCDEKSGPRTVLNVSTEVLTVATSCTYSVVTVNLCKVKCGIIK